MLPEPLGVGDGGADFLLDAEEGAGLAGEGHAVENLFQQEGKGGPLAGRELLLDEFAEQLLFPRHRLGADEVRAGDAGPVGGLHAGLVPGALGAQPEAQPGDLRGARVDVDAVDVVLDDEAGHFAEERRFVGKGGGEGDEGREGLGGLRGVVRAVGDFPGFVVDDGEEVEGVEAEVHGAARRVEQPDFARVFERTMRDVDGLPEQFFLREIFPGLRLTAGGALRRGLAGFQKNLRGPADEVAAALAAGRSRRASSHTRGGRGCCR